MLKPERASRRRYRSVADARADVFDYIERFHNPRIQRRIDSLTQGRVT
jgi:putative transposase